MVPRHQVIPSAILAEISDFIHCFDRVTAREAWQAAALREARRLFSLDGRRFVFSAPGIFIFPPEAAGS